MAKEQGLRSRAAFKLTQINKQYPLLEKCQHAVLDLCAAPGGWTQIAARTCSKQIPILAVDILPIRKLTGHPNVSTIIGDITTQACQSEIHRSIGQCDLVLHDGAPNVGADYAKDAYEQNEIALCALKCATHHLIPGGSFVTKVYRSRDYAKYQWVLQQLFDSVHAFKPKASRAQSAEIFLVAQKYKAPQKLDPRLLDPKYVFSSVDNDTTGGGNASANAATSLTVLGKQAEQKTRKRGGYDMDHLDATMRHIEPVSGFLESTSLRDAIQILSRSTGLSFVCGECKENSQEASCSCQFYLNHPLTNSDIKESVSDLQLLNKTDFKRLLSWRVKMQEARKARVDEDDEDDDASSQDDDQEVSSDNEEEEIQAEIKDMKQRRLRERKKLKKKERALAAKRRRRAALGMDLNAVDLPEHDKLFSLATITNKGDLAAASEINLDQMTDEQIFGGSDDEIVLGEDPDADADEDEGDRLDRMQRELDEAYSTYLENTKDGLAKSGTKMQKRSKRVQRLQLVEEAAEDDEMALAGRGNVHESTRAYAKLLQGNDSDADSNDSSDDDEDDGFDAAPMTPDEFAQLNRARKRKSEANPLLHTFADESASDRTARWFSNPLFESIAKSAQTKKSKSTATSDDDSIASGDNEDRKARQPREKKGLDAEEVIAMMPKTDKEIRHEKRLKRMARDERRAAKKAKKMGDLEGEFELVPAANDDESEEDETLKDLSPQKRKQALEAQKLIKAGMGAIDDDQSTSRMEIVAQDRPLPVLDDRKYDSEHENYDSDDYAETLALGTMMLRKSKEKALVDASYNRYAWNDPADLPEWFQDDENRHYRPQLPIPPALLAKMKEKMLALSAKPIKKVAEARARKSKRARDKLAAAKKKAEALANSSEMSEAMKLKAISKALRGQEAKRPGKTYVVAKKGRGLKAGGKNVALVDKRMKSDKRGMKRAEKRGRGKSRK